MTLLTETTYTQKHITDEMTKKNLEFLDHNREGKAFITDKKTKEIYFNTSWVFSGHVNYSAIKLTLKRAEQLLQANPQDKNLFNHYEGSLVSLSRYVSYLDKELYQDLIYKLQKLLDKRLSDKDCPIRTIDALENLKILSTLADGKFVRTNSSKQRLEFSDNEETLDISLFELTLTKAQMIYQQLNSKRSHAIDITLNDFVELYQKALKGLETLKQNAQSTHVLSYTALLRKFKADGSDIKLGLEAPHPYAFTLRTTSKTAERNPLMEEIVSRQVKLKPVPPKESPIPQLTEAQQKRDEIFKHRRSSHLPDIQKVKEEEPS